MLVCQYCKTDKNKSGVLFSGQGPLNLHEKSCADNPKNIIDIPIEIESVDEIYQEENVTRETSVKCPECETRGHLLNEKIPWCKKAIEMGYKRVCPECKEVY